MKVGSWCGCCDRARTLRARQLQLDHARALVDGKQLADSAHGLAVELRAVDLLGGDADGGLCHGACRKINAQ